MCLYAAVSFLAVWWKSASRLATAFGFLQEIPLALTLLSTALGNSVRQIQTRWHGAPRRTERVAKLSPWARPPAEYSEQSAQKIAEQARASSGLAAVQQRSEELLAELSPKLRRPLLPQEPSSPSANSLQRK